MVLLFPLELQLHWTHRVFPVISRFLKILTCPYLGNSHFGRPPVFRKQYVLDTALPPPLMPSLTPPPLPKRSTSKKFIKLKADQIKLCNDHKRIQCTWLCL